MRRNIGNFHFEPVNGENDSLNSWSNLIILWDGMFRVNVIMIHFAQNETTRQRHEVANALILREIKKRKEKIRERSRR